MLCWRESRDEDASLCNQNDSRWGRSRNFARRKYIPYRSERQSIRMQVLKLSMLNFQFTTKFMFAPKCFGAQCTGDTTSKETDVLEGKGLSDFFINMLQDMKKRRLMIMAAANSICFVEDSSPASNTLGLTRIVLDFQSQGCFKRDNKSNLFFITREVELW